MSYVDLDDEDKIQECSPENRDEALEQLAIAIKNLAESNANANPIMTVIANFWLNEIKSLDDTVRLISNINIVLIAAYSTIVATLLFGHFNDLATGYPAIAHMLPTDKPVSSILVLIAPIFYWISSIIISNRNHGTPKNTESTLDNKKILDYFINVYNFKRYIKLVSFNFQIFGLFYFFVLFEICDFILNFSLAPVIASIYVFLGLIYFSRSLWHLTKAACDI